MKILVVDDSKAMRMIVMRTLRQLGLGSHTLIEAASGAEALKLVRSDKPGLVLADWNMPEMNGFELLKSLKAENLPAKLGFVTSECTPEIQEMAKAEGALFFLSKPFTAEGMQAAVGPFLK